eukprot:4073577-Prymnesium_polylepis.3
MEQNEPLQMQSPGTTTLPPPQRVVLLFHVLFKVGATGHQPAPRTPWRILLMRRPDDRRGACGLTRCARAGAGSAVFHPVARAVQRQLRGDLCVRDDSLRPRLLDGQECVWPPVGRAALVEHHRRCWRVGVAF